MSTSDKREFDPQGWTTDSARPMALSFPTGTDPASIRARVEAMELLLGLIPVLGDVITTALGAYIVWEARNLGLSKWQLSRMGANVAFDTLIGLVPLVGDAADLMFRSNSRNLRIIKKHLDKHHPQTRVIAG